MARRGSKAARRRGRGFAAPGLLGVCWVRLVALLSQALRPGCRPLALSCSCGRSSLVHRGFLCLRHQSGRHLRPTHRRVHIAATLGAPATVTALVAARQAVTPCRRRRSEVTTKYRGGDAPSRSPPVQIVNETPSRQVRAKCTRQKSKPRVPLMHRTGEKASGEVDKRGKSTRFCVLQYENMFVFYKNRRFLIPKWKKMAVRLDTIETTQTKRHFSRRERVERTSLIRKSV